RRLADLHLRREGDVGVAAEGLVRGWPRAVDRQRAGGRTSAARSDRFWAQRRRAGLLGGRVGLQDARPSGAREVERVAVSQARLPGRVSETQEATVSSAELVPGAPQAGPPLPAS